MAHLRHKERRDHVEEIRIRGRRGTLSLLAALLAGVVNGWLGTGGGMILVLALTRLYPEGEREALTLSTACIFCFSVVSVILYHLGGHMVGMDALPILVPALLGGALGALLLNKSAPELLEGVFAALLIFSGVRLLM